MSAGQKRGAAVTRELSSEDPGPSKKAPKRQVTKSTFEKWQREHERQHSTVSWLRCELDRDKAHVVSLSCAVCTKYESYVSSLKNFSKAWISGSTNLKVSNLIDHATSEVHKVAMGRMRAEHAKDRGESPAMSSTLGRYFSTLDEGTRARLRRKFDVCYAMAKESIPFAKYPALLALEARHGVDLGSAYCTPESARIFTGYIAASQRQAFVNALSECHFFSFLMDGTTDAGNQEDELIVLVHCSKDDSTQELTPRTRFLSIHSPKQADASGLLDCLRDALKLLDVDDILDKDKVLGVEDKPVLVGGGTDGAAVNVGEHSGLKGQLQRALPWLFWSWCYAHRLELACKDAFSSPLFSNIEEMLLRLYYLYEKSPKKSRELASIVDDLEAAFEFPKGGNLPIRCQGTRWITHKRKALQRVLDRFGAYIAHLTTLIEDTSVRAGDRDRLKGYIKKWKDPKMLFGCAMFIDALKPVSLLSLTLQNENADIVMSIENTLKSVKSLKSLSEQDPKEWPTVKLMKSRINVSSQEYQGVVLENIDACLEQCKVHVLADLQRLDRRIQERLEWSDLKLLRSILVFVETQSWLQRSSHSSEDDGDDGLLEIRAAVECITSVFRAPLEAKGLCDPCMIQDEVEEVVEYARKYLPIGTESYRKIWHKLYTCPDSRRWPNILFLCELVFSLPLSTSRVEQMFSLLKIIKTKRRTNLLTSTLCDLLEISVEGPPLTSFDANAAVDYWWKDSCTPRRVNQSTRKEYRPRAGTDDACEEGENSEDTTLALDDWDDWLHTDSAPDS